MVDTEQEVEILTRPVSVSKEQARRRVENRLVARVKNLYSDQTVARAVLRYKPYYEFPTALTKQYLFDEDDVRHGAIIVDTMTGITRPILEEDIEVDPERVPESRVLDPELDEAEARVEANGRRMQIEHKEKGDVEMEETPRLVHKPVWLVELANGEVQVVDATDGQVISDVVLG